MVSKAAIHELINPRIDVRAALVAAMPQRSLRPKDLDLHDNMSMHPRGSQAFS